MACLGIKRKFVYIHWAGADNLMVILHRHSSIMSNIQIWVQWSIFLFCTTVLINYVFSMPCKMSFVSKKIEQTNHTFYIFPHICNFSQFLITPLLIPFFNLQLRWLSRYIIFIYLRLKNIKIWFPKHLSWQNHTFNATKIFRIPRDSFIVPTLI